jgi:hypothetical protein
MSRLEIPCRAATKMKSLQGERHFHFQIISEPPGIILMADSCCWLADIFGCLVGI